MDMPNPIACLVTLFRWAFLLLCRERRQSTLQSDRERRIERSGASRFMSARTISPTMTAAGAAMIRIAPTVKVRPTTSTITRHG
jgi:hypothetical protein